MTHSICVPLSSSLYMSSVPYILSLNLASFITCSKLPFIILSDIQFLSNGIFILFYQKKSSSDTYIKSCLSLLVSNVLSFLGLFTYVTSFNV